MVVCSVLLNEAFACEDYLDVYGSVKLNIYFQKKKKIPTRSMHLPRAPATRGVDAPDL